MDAIAMQAATPGDAVGGTTSPLLPLNHAIVGVADAGLIKSRSREPSPAPMQKENHTVAAYVTPVGGLQENVFGFAAAASAQMPSSMSVANNSQQSMASASSSSSKDASSDSLLDMLDDEIADEEAREAGSMSYHATPAAPESAVDVVAGVHVGRRAAAAAPASAAVVESAEHLERPPPLGHDSSSIEAPAFDTSDVWQSGVTLMSSDRSSISSAAGAAGDEPEFDESDTEHASAVHPEDPEAPSPDIIRVEDEGGHVTGHADAAQTPVSSTPLAAAAPASAAAASAVVATGAGSPQSFATADETDAGSASADASAQPEPAEQPAEREETAEERAQRELEESEALCRQLMQQESLEAYMQAQEAVMRSMAQGQDEEETQEGGGADRAFALQVAQGEQHDGGGEGEEDEDLDPDELDYDQLLELGERIGDVAQERWRLEAQTHIDKIPTETWEDDESDDHKCAVCQCNFERGEEMRVLGCSHRFHVDCIDGWLRGRPTCPMCKTSIKEEQAQQGADQELSQVAGAL